MTEDFKKGVVAGCALMLGYVNDGAGHVDPKHAAQIVMKVVRRFGLNLPEMDPLVQELKRELADG